MKHHVSRANSAFDGPDKKQYQHTASQAIAPSLRGEMALYDEPDPEGEFMQ